MIGLIHINGSNIAQSIRNRSDFAQLIRTCCRMFGSIIYVIVVDKNTTNKLKLHCETKNNLICSEKWQNRQQSEINHLSIANELKSQHAQEVKKNREYLQFIIENLLFLGKQGLALRGHEESSNSKNKGNFLEL
jgi:hypothetical protein